MGARDLAFEHTGLGVQGSHCSCHHHLGLQLRGDEGRGGGAAACVAFGLPLHGGRTYSAGCSVEARAACFLGQGAFGRRPSGRVRFRGVLDADGWA